MSDSHLSTPGEKRPASQDTHTSQIKPKSSFLSANKDASIVVEKKDPDDHDDVVVDAKLAQSIQPVSFFSLFQCVPFYIQLVSQPDLSTGFLLHSRL